MRTTKDRKDVRYSMRVSKTELEMMHRVAKKRGKKVSQIIMTTFKSWIRGMLNERSFVMMTWEFIRDKDTTMQEKFILAEIEALTAIRTWMHCAQ